MQRRTNIPNPSYPTSTVTEFFRQPNMSVFARTVAPILVKTMGTPLHIAEVGCSSGEETWSLAAALSAAGVDYHIDAIDANPEALRQTRRGYKIDYYAQPPKPGALARLSLEWHANVCKFDQKSLDYFKRGRLLRNYVRPVPELVKRVTFWRQNVLEEPLQAAQYGAVVMNNVLYHYGEEGDRNTLASNALVGLRDQGIFITDERSENKVSLSNFSLSPVMEAIPYQDTVLRFAM